MTRGLELAALYDPIGVVPLFGPQRLALNNQRYMSPNGLYDMTNENLLLHFGYGAWETDDAVLLQNIELTYGVGKRMEYERIHKQWSLDKYNREQVLPARKILKLFGIFLHCVKLPAVSATSWQLVGKEVLMAVPQDSAKVSQMFAVTLAPFAAAMIATRSRVRLPITSDELLADCTAWQPYLTHMQCMELYEELQRRMPEVVDTRIKLQLTRGNRVNQMQLVPKLP